MSGAPIQGTSLTGAIPAGTNTIGAVTEANLDAAIGSQGATAPSKGLLIGGSDGTDLRAILTDSTGKPQVALASALPAGTNSIGAVTEQNLDATIAATGAAAPAKAVLFGGSDGTDLRALAVDSSGRLIGSVDLVALELISN